MIRLGLVLCVLLAVPVTAQSPAQPSPLSEIEALRVQNVNLKVVILRDEIAHLKADLERVRPGWIWNPDDGAWTKAPEGKSGR